MKAPAAARGYDRHHRQLRAWWQKQIDGGGVVCSRPECEFPGRMVLPGMLWDLDHTDDRSGYLGPAHRRCNRAAGARKGNRARAAGRRVPYVW